MPANFKYFVFVISYIKKILEMKFKKLIIYYKIEFISNYKM